MTSLKESKVSQTQDTKTPVERRSRSSEVRMDFKRLDQRPRPQPTEAGENTGCRSAQKWLLKCVNLVSESEINQNTTIVHIVLYQQ